MKMQAPTDVAKNKRLAKKILTVILSIFAVIVSVCVMRYKDIAKCNPRYGMIEILNGFFSEPWHFYIDPGTFFLLFFIFFAGYAMLSVSKMTSDLRKHDDPETVVGDAHFMTEEELADYQLKKCDPIGKPGTDDFSNVILSKDMALSTNGYLARLNANVLCIGGSGAGKSRFFGAPNILQAMHNFIITDPSGELKTTYAKYLENQGYEILTFDITDFYRSNKYNPFHYIREEADIMVMVNTLIKNTTSEHKGGEDFWEKGEALLLEAVCLYIWHTYEPENQTFSQVLKLLSLAEVDENDATAKSPLDILFINLAKEDPDNLAVKQYNKFKSGAGKTMKSFLISVNTRLEKFDLPAIKYLTSDDDFHFEDFANSKRAIFVITPTADETFQFLVSFFYSQFFMTVYSYAEKQARYAYLVKHGDELLKVFPASDKADSKRAKKEAAQFIKYCNSGLKIVHNKKKQYFEVRIAKTNEVVGWRGTKEDAQKYAALFKNIKIEQCGSYCPHYVQLILDEFANVSQIPNFQKIVATIRKYRICVFIILQSLAQLKKIYPDEAQSIIANCNVKLLLGTDDDETNKWISESLLGSKTVVVMNRSENAKGEWNTSYNRTKQPLLEVTQISSIDSDYCMVVVKGFPPYYGRKYDVCKHPHYEYAMQYKDQFETEMSEEAIAYMRAHSGPLRTRQSNIIAELNGTANGGLSEDTNVEPKPKKDKQSDSKDKQSLNNKLKKKAEQEKNEIQNELVADADMTLSGSYVPPYDGYYNDQVMMDSFGITPGTKSELIEAAVTEQIVLEELTSEKIKYTLTK